MQWAGRVRQRHIRRLFKLAQMGVYDDELLLEVGWGFYARCEDVLTVARAVKGEVPCPQCGAVTYRPRYYLSLRRSAGGASHPTFSCPGCFKAVTWWGCKEALRNRPRCFDCLAILIWKYSEQTLSCDRCRRTWLWRQYRKSIKRRTVLPCPHCGGPFSRPQRTRQEGDRPEKREKVRLPDEVLLCPSCARPGVHEKGVFRCPSCGYEKEWRVYIRRLKRRNARLVCRACGHTFTWHAWRREQLRRDAFLSTGNPAPIRAFLDRWPKCRTPQEQIIQIDNLLHALHARGPQAPMFIEGSSAGVMAFLDELATG